MKPKEILKTSLKEGLKNNRTVLKTSAVFLSLMLVLGLSVQHALNENDYYVQDVSKVLEQAHVTVLYESGTHVGEIKIVNGEKGWFAVNRENPGSQFRWAFDIVDKDEKLLLDAVSEQIYDQAGEGYLLLERLGEDNAYLNLETLEITEISEEEESAFYSEMRKEEKKLREEAEKRLNLNDVKLTDDYVFGEAQKTAVAQVYDHDGKLLFEGSPQEDYLGALRENILVVWDTAENTYRYYTMGLQGVEKIIETGEVYCFMDFEDGYAAACRPLDPANWYTQRATVRDYDPLDYTMEGGIFVYSYLDENLEPVFDFVMRDASFSQNGYAVVSGLTNGYILLNLTQKGGAPWTLESD